MVFEKEFKGVPDGEIYPVDYKPGDECPPELLAAAKELGAVAAEGAEGKAGSKKAKSE